MNNQIPRFENEEERADYARKLALKVVAEMDPEEVAKWGEQNLVSDLTHQCLMELPSSQDQRMRDRSCQ